MLEKENTRPVPRVPVRAFVFVPIPFSRGSRRHTEGLLQVELACGDGVCRLRQTDAAIPEELKTSS